MVLTPPLGWCRVSKGSKVIGVRLDLNTIEELKKKTGGDISKALKQLIKQYVESPELVRTELPENIEKLLGEFQERVNEYIAKIKQFCEEHSKVITENHEKERDKYNYWLNTCLHRHRIITYNTLKIYAEKTILKNAKAEDKNELEKRIREIIDKAVNDIYPSQYPPLYE